ncbi:MAG: c-type cytochrome domain-containing protein, partial [Verrucomicrobiota bacterium]
MTRILRSLGLATLAGVLATATAAPPAFERDVAPLLSTHCHACHGPKKQESGLRLDSRDSALKGGDHCPALVPGKASESGLVLAIEGRHPEVEPMPHRRDPLARAEVATIRAWIDAGAEWPASAQAGAHGKDGAKAAVHWAFQPVTPTAPPKVRGATHPIDRFVRECLGKEGLQPSPEADRATLL